MPIDAATNKLITQATPRDILTRHKLSHGWGVLELKHLVEIYGIERMDRKYYDTDVENLINGKHI